MSVNIRSTKTRVEIMLMKYEHLRDNDDRLIATILLNDIKKLGFKAQDISGMKVLELLAEGKLTNPESIRRSRAKLQEEKPTLRGRVYNLRKNKAKDIRNDLGYSQ